MNSQDVEKSASCASGSSCKHWLILEQFAQGHPEPAAGMGLEEETDMTPKGSQSTDPKIQGTVAQSSTQPPHPQILEGDNLDKHWGEEGTGREGR